MSDYNLISIDIAKNVFQVCEWNIHGKVIKNRKVKRKELLPLIANKPKSVIAIEACYTSHYWGRKFESLGHIVKVIPAQHVTPFVRGNKNDANDAVAIGEASCRPGLRTVQIKTLHQQDIQAILRIRERHVQQRTSACNQVRALLSDYGIICSTGWCKLMASLPLAIEDAENDLTVHTRQMIDSLYREIKQITEYITQDEIQLQNLICEDEAVFKRLRTIPGVGLLTAASIISHIGNASQFHSARDLSAWIGLTPKSFASGEKSTSAGISKRGSRQLRTLLIHGARAALFCTKDREQPLMQWADSIAERRGNNKAVVALANKLARIVWVIIKREETFCYPAKRLV